MPIEILIPTAESRKAGKGLASRVDKLDNKVICILDNNWQSYVPFVDRLQQLLVAKYPSARVFRKTKFEKVRGASKSLIDELAANCQVVINGLCG